MEPPLRAPDRICGGRSKRNPSEHLMGAQARSRPQPSTEMKAHRWHAFEKCRTRCSANVQAPTHPDHRVEGDRRASRERGSRGTLQSAEEQAACRRTGSRDGAGAPPRPAVGTALARLLDRRVGRLAGARLLDQRLGAQPAEGSGCRRQPKGSGSGASETALARAAVSRRRWCCRQRTS